MSLRLKLVIAAVAGLNLLAVLALLALAGFGTAMLAIGLTAYGLGLRHAFDADHIAAIDNVTRRLRQAGQKPVAAGFFFSLGHSTVVVLLILCLALAFRHVHAALQGLMHWGALVSDAGSALVLTAVGLANLLMFRRLLQGRDGGALTSRFRRLWSAADASWKMYPMGMLFGLGFDTATEVALLAISAGALQGGQLPLWAVMLLPLSFAAGMCLMDSLQGLLMLRLYGWAMADGNRSLKLNTVVTGLSVLLALGVAGVKWAGLGGLVTESTGLSSLAGSSAVGLIASGLLAALWFTAYLWRRRLYPPARA